MLVILRGLQWMIQPSIWLPQAAKTTRWSAARHWVKIPGWIWVRSKKSKTLSQISRVNLSAQCKKLMGQGSGRYWATPHATKPVGTHRIVPKLLLGFLNAKRHVKGASEQSMCQTIDRVHHASGNSTASMLTLAWLAPFPLTSNGGDGSGLQPVITLGFDIESIDVSLFYWGMFSFFTAWRAWLLRANVLAEVAKVSWWGLRATNPKLRN